MSDSLLGVMLPGVVTGLGVIYFTQVFRHVPGEYFQAARICGLNLIAQVRAACGGDLDRVVSVAKLGGFVNCTADFTDHPEVINGASDLMVEVFGEAGKHARFAVGAPTLPRGVAVEVDAIFEIK